MNETAFLTPSQASQTAQKRSQTSRAAATAAARSSYLQAIIL